MDPHADAGRASQHGSARGSPVSHKAATALLPPDHLLAACLLVLPAAHTHTGAAQCNVCLPGSFAAAAKSSTCAECPRGTFQNKYGSQECSPCKEGTYQDARAAAKCKVCPAGTFNPEKGSVTAQACQ